MSDRGYDQARCYSSRTPPAGRVCKLSMSSEATTVHQQAAGRLCSCRQLTLGGLARSFSNCLRTCAHECITASVMVCLLICWCSSAGDISASDEQVWAGLLLCTRTSCRSSPHCSGRSCTARGLTWRICTSPPAGRSARQQAAGRGRWYANGACSKSVAPAAHKMMT